MEVAHTDVALSLENEVPRFSVDDVIQIPVSSGDDGLTLDLTSLGLIVVDIGEGAVQRHNETSESDYEKVRVHDVVVSVNDELDPHGMLQIFANLKDYTLAIVHPWVTQVRIHKRTGKLGLGLKHTPGSIVIQIESIGEGDVQLHNETAEPSQRVHERSLIGAVNGVSCKSRNMLAWLKHSKDYVDVTLYRALGQSLGQSAGCNPDKVSI